MSVDGRLRSLGYPDRVIEVYHRLGPKSRAVVYNAGRRLDLQELLRLFHSSRKIPDPLWVGDEFIPQPLPTVYAAGQGDEELATWLLKRIGRRLVSTPAVTEVRASPVWEREVDL